MHPSTTITALLLALAASAACARPPGTNCPDSPVEGAVQPDDPLAPLFTNLAPGTSVLLGGTDAGSNADLVGTTIKNLSLSYSWSSGGGTAVGSFKQKVSNATGTNKCVLQHQVQSSASSTLRVCALRVTHLLYPMPNPVYAEYRTDSSPPGDVDGKRAIRSGGAGTTVRFTLKRCLNPGEFSEVLILVTTAPQVTKDATVRLEAEDGSLSPALKVWNTLVP